MALVLKYFDIIRPCNFNSFIPLSSFFLFLFWKRSDNGRILLQHPFAIYCHQVATCEELKVRFQLCVMRMANATKNRLHRISIGVLPFVRMQTVTMTKWITACSDWSECECFIGRENNSHTEPPESSAYCAEVKLHWSLLICICSFTFTFALCTSGILPLDLGFFIISECLLLLFFSIFFQSQWCAEACNRPCQIS